MELRGFEPLTFCMPCSRVSSDSVVLGLVAAVQSGSDVRGRLARSGEIWGALVLDLALVLQDPSRSDAHRSRRLGAGEDRAGHVRGRAPIIQLWVSLVRLPVDRT